MEPGHEDREYGDGGISRSIPSMPQWSPVMKTGNTAAVWRQVCLSAKPQWSPVMKTGNTTRSGANLATTSRASMEPGHEDREYQRCRILPVVRLDASMEPGHEDREYRPHPVGDSAGEKPQWSPVMKTGNTTGSKLVGAAVAGLNGARS